MMLAVKGFNNINSNINNYSKDVMNNDKSIDTK